MDLATPIVVPKEAAEVKRQKKRILSLKRRSKSASTSSLPRSVASPEKAYDKENKDAATRGLMFGIPLSQCLTNDRQLAKWQSSSVVTTPTRVTSGVPDDSNYLRLPRVRKSSSSSHSSLDNGTQPVLTNGVHGDIETSSASDTGRHAFSSDSQSESDQSSSRHANSSLTETGETRLSVASDGDSTDTYPIATPPRIPRVVNACFRHIESYGLHVLGIFRVGSSRKRVKQLRQEFDCGNWVHLTKEHNAHDVGGLLKEFFRDLPDTILTRDLFQAFVNTRKLKCRERQLAALKLLMTLLPAANRDTLWALLQFLSTVSQHSADGTDSTGQDISGNKMDSHNLATLFGPNLLHRGTRHANEREFLAECADRAESCSDVIEVVKDLIDRHGELFVISAEQRDEVLKLMMESDQDSLEEVLRHMSNENRIEPDPESVYSVFEADGTELAEPTLSSLKNNSDTDLLSFPHRNLGTVLHHHLHHPLRITRSAEPCHESRSNCDADVPIPFMDESRDLASKHFLDDAHSQSQIIFKSVSESVRRPFAPAISRFNRLVDENTLLTCQETGNESFANHVTHYRSPVSLISFNRTCPGNLSEMSCPTEILIQNKRSTSITPSRLSNPFKQIPKISSSYCTTLSSPISNSVDSLTRRVVVPDKYDTQSVDVADACYADGAKFYSAGSSELQREQWRLWENVTACKGDQISSDVEQETLV